MTPKTPADLRLEANEADVLEQQHPIADDDPVEFPEELPRRDADPADVLDQHFAVPIDDDDERTS